MYSCITTQSLYSYRSLLEEEQFTTCFSDYHDLLVAARAGKNGYVRQIASYKMKGPDNPTSQFHPKIRKSG